MRTESEIGELGLQALSYVGSMCSHSIGNSYGSDVMTVKAIHAVGIITDQDMEEPLTQYALRTGYSEFRKLMDGTRRHPDHSSPEFLVFLFEHGSGLSVDEVNSLNFRHGNTLAEFCEMYRRLELLSELRDTLFNQQPVSEHKFVHH
jgi:hypothetical protein